MYKVNDDDERARKVGKRHLIYCIKILPDPF